MLISFYTRFLLSSLLMNNKKNIFFLLFLLNASITWCANWDWKIWTSVGKKYHSIYAMTTTLSFARLHRSSAEPVINLVPSRQLFLLLLTTPSLFSARISLSPTAKSVTPSSTHYSSLWWNRISRDFPFSRRRCIIPQRQRPSPHSFWLLQDWALFPREVLSPFALKRREANRGPYNIYA